MKQEYNSNYQAMERQLTRIVLYHMVLPVLNIKTPLLASTSQRLIQSMLADKLTNSQR